MSMLLMSSSRSPENTPGPPASASAAAATARTSSATAAASAAAAAAAEAASASAVAVLLPAGSPIVCMRWSVRARRARIAVVCSLHLLLLDGLLCRRCCY
jgi:hypothetical protein